MERNKNKIKNSKIKNSKIDWSSLDLKEVKAACEAIDKSYNKYCKDNGLDPDKPEGWSSVK